MPRNLEIKARIARHEDAVEIARSLGARVAGVLRQRDTYFHVQQGRLKLREVVGQHAELIFYERGEQSARRVSEYEILPCIEPVVLRGMLSRALGIRVTVEKVRMLFMFGETRIHIDEVVGLGSYVEFEVPLTSSDDDASRIMNSLIQVFNIGEHDIFRGSYSDLLLGAT